MARPGGLFLAVPMFALSVWRVGVLWLPESGGARQRGAVQHQQSCQKGLEAEWLCLLTAVHSVISAPMGCTSLVLHQSDSGSNFT